MKITEAPESNEELQSEPEAPRGMVQRLGVWLESLPEFLRPPVYGALFIVMFALHRGALFVVPILIILVLFTSKTPLATLGRGAAYFGLAMLGGALSGLAYSLIGRRVRGAFRGAWYLAGVLTAAPYALVLTYVVRFGDRKPLLAPLETGDLVVAAIIAVLGGLILGGAFAPDGGKHFFGDDD